MSLRLPKFLLRICSGFLALCVLPIAAQAAEGGVEKSVVYGTPGNTKLLLDVYQPTTDFTGKRPGVVLVHGGGWIFGDKSYYETLGKLLAEKGYVAFSINYRLAPQFHYPAQVDDAQLAVRWIRAHADKYNVDASRLGALGDSAGGYLVSFLGMRETRLNEDKDLAGYSSRVQCVVDLFGPEDFTEKKSNVSKEAMQILENFFGKTYDQAPKLYREGSPIIYVNRRSAPFLILHGNADTLVPISQSEKLRDALKKAGVEASLIVMEKEKHGWFVNADNQKKAADAIEAFFAQHLKP